MTKSQDTQPSAAALWISNPPLDLIVGCGAWSLPLLLITYFASNQATLIWSVSFYVLAFFFNYPHYMATIYRAYHRPEDFQRYRIFTVHITGLVLLTVLLSHFWVRALPWIFTLYLTLSPWHYSGQNYGLFMMFARRAGAKPNPNERDALYSAFLLSYLILFLSFHTGPSHDPLFLSLGIPGRLSSMLLIPLALAFIAVSAYGLSRLSEQVGWRPLLPALTLYSTQFVWFLLPTLLSLGERLRIPQSRYSTGILAVMHSAQYLWITSYYARREGAAENAKPWRPLAYFGVLIIGGIALFVPGPWLASRVFHYDFSTSFLIFTALVNLHHFILDGAIWKLRDGRVAALLLDSQAKAQQTASAAGNRLVSALRWITGDSAAARRLRYSAAALLLFVGGVDQVRYYLALHQERLDYLKHAATLNAFDSSVQSKLGIQELQAGQEDSGISALRKAVQMNPADTVARNTLLKFLVDRGRYDEAYQLTRQTLGFAPKDPDVLVNHGVLAQKLGHPEESIASWQKALQADPNQTQAHLYLARELDAEGKLDAAIPHYVMYLEGVSRSDPRTQPPPRSLIAVVLRLAQCQVQTHREDQAGNAYDLAEKIAAQTGEKQLESFAAIGHAELSAKLGNKADALRLYQHSLRLDEGLNDPHSSAADWYGYAMFLKQAGFETRLSYACLLKAETLVKLVNNAPELEPILNARQQTEAALGNQARDIRQHQDSALHDALTLKAQ